MSDTSKFLTIEQIEAALGIDYRASILSPISHPLLQERNITLLLKRDDQLHTIISGNKWRKLKYILMHALEQGHMHLISMGGAWSNHLHALAYIGQQLNIKTTGLIRGEASSYESPTLQDMRDWGMHIKFIDRGDFRILRSFHTHDAEPAQRYQGYWIPEGGATPLALTGVAELKQEIDADYDKLVVACGTGTTLAGLLAQEDETHHVIGIAALQGESFLEKEICRLLGDTRQKERGWRLYYDYHFGGFAKRNQLLDDFMQRLETASRIPLEPVYTGKMMYALFDLIEDGSIGHGETVVAVHSGGLQGKRAIGN